LVREDGALQPTTWDVALGRVQERFEAIAESEPDGLAVLGSGQQTNEAAYALGKLARGGIGTRHYDANTTLCMASAVTAYYNAFGSDAPPCTYDDIGDARTHVVWGANPAVAHPVMFRWIAKSARAGDSRLVVVDPVETETVQAADKHVPLEPGTDLALARAVLARVLERDDLDREFIAENTDGFDELRARLPSVDVAIEEAGVARAAVDELAAAFTERTLVYWGMGVNQSIQGTKTAGALIDLCLATGNVGPGSGPFSLTGQANSMGTRICSSKGSWPGQRPFTDPDERRTVSEAWDVPVERLPSETGPGPVGMLEAVGKGDIEAVWTVATNPVAGMPDATAVREHLAECFLVVQDAFRTETVELADVVLPAATWGESNGTATNMERRISRVRPVMEVPSGVRTDLDIITSIGERLCSGLFEATDPEAIFEEFAALSAGTPADCSGISYARLDEAGAVRWPAPDAISEGGYRYLEGSEDGTGEWSFETPSGQARFSTGTHGPVAEPPREEFPLTLTTAREADGYNTGVRSRDGDEPVSPLARVHPETLADCEFHEAMGGPDADGAEFATDDNDEFPAAVLSSPRGEISVRVAPDAAVPTDLVWLSIHHPRTNELTLPDVDPQSAEPNLKQCAVRLSPATDPVPSSTMEVIRSD
jgi:assimilatory nitrate reductase catalytic subunit